MKFVVYLLEIYMRFSKVAIFGVIAVVEKRDSKKKGGKKKFRETFGHFYIQSDEHDYLMVQF